MARFAITSRSRPSSPARVPLFVRWAPALPVGLNAIGGTLAYIAESKAILSLPKAAGGIRPPPWHAPGR